MTRAVLFDVDFTLIYPGPMFQGEGYRAFCAKHGMIVDADAFDAAVQSASYILEEPDDALYAPQIFIDYLRMALPCDMKNPHGAAACKESPYKIK